MVCFNYLRILFNYFTLKFKDDKVVTLSKQNKLLENEKETLISNQQRLSTVNQNLEAEKRDLLSLLDKKIKDNDRLNG